MKNFINFFRVTILEIFELRNLEDSFKDYTNNIANKSIIFLDSLDFLFERFNFTQIVRLITNLCSKNTAVISVVKQNEASLNWRSLEYISRSTMTLNFFENRYLVCQTRVKKRDGLISKKVNFNNGI